MKDVRLQLDDIGYTELTELARSLIPTLAPAWTDHNAHDPGIMLTELLAWIAEAQIYSLGRVRRDERRAFAALLGVRARGAAPAQGLVWPTDPLPVARVLAADQRVRPPGAEAPPYCCSHSLLLWQGKRIAQLKACRGDGSEDDVTDVNRLHGVGFTPFSDPPLPQDRLELQLNGDWPAVPSDPHAPLGADALLSIGFDLALPGQGRPRGGVEEAPDTVEADADAFGAACLPTCPESASLQVLLRGGGEERELTVVEDTTHGLLRSGVVLVACKPRRVLKAPLTLVLRGAQGGFLRSPVIRRVDLNVVPIVQREQVALRVEHFGTGAPDRSWTLPVGAMVERGNPTLEVKSEARSGHMLSWSRVEDLAACSPECRVYRVDTANGQLVFGNGLNGRAFPPGASLQVACWTTKGAGGGLPAGLMWRVPGVQADFGSNIAVVSGGRAVDDLAELRRRARERVREARPLVTSADLGAAALALTGLGVARVAELPIPALKRGTPPRPRGLRVLVAAGRHGADGRDGGTESARWLDEIARRLAPRLPLGQRLRVISPRFVELRVRATLQAAAQADPEQVARRAMACLRDQLSPLDDGEIRAWPFGRDVTPLQVRSCLRQVAGVLRVEAVELVLGGRPLPAGKALRVGLSGLPKLVIDRQDLTVTRGPGRAP
ncbi:putative baseplate assembly protein [Variovorax sp. J2P1-59]|uniref:putative baseplate assembly protein n=1 Tax=Variovorax flavidus TaxID=3053501 RepID=UPI002578E8C9|nr:putative baseplate assembly protein [Variovorax sp. J2P1-59]MDM0076901.1 putative baseplate assembly protein [Variovorax sp. J2P1-59]